DLLRRYSWPGNVRELEHVVERSVLLNREAPALDLKHLPPDLVERAEAGAKGAAPSSLVRLGHESEGESVLSVELPAEPIAWDDLERGILEATLRICGGNVSAAARRLRLGRGQLRYRMRRLGIDVPDQTRYRPRRRSRRRRSHPRVA
ncbi:MAG: hypothetical protein GF355_13660, partial [Candidatus Eisenbacteria bacterium]|nr:hypothetical protein [Candidatus Eisenbacteria bacterium]